MRISLVLRSPESQTRNERCFTAPVEAAILARMAIQILLCSVSHMHAQEAQSLRRCGLCDWHDHPISLTQVV